jgi:hypothetical protein
VLDASDWRDLQLAGGPSPRDGVGMARDTNTGYLLVTHGRDGGCSYSYFADAWWLGALPQAAVTVFGTGCAGSSGVPFLAAAPNSLPRIGRPFAVRVSNIPITGFFVAAVPFFGFDITSSGGAPLPRDLGLLGMPGCTQYVDPYSTGFLFTPIGTADWTIGIPNVAVYAGMQVRFQSLVIDPPANAFGATLTNAATATLGW